MKRFAIALTALSLVAGAASAANEAPEAAARPAEALQSVSVEAGKILSTRELERAGIKADAKLNVSNFGTDGVHNTYER